MTKQLPGILNRRYKMRDITELEELHQIETDILTAIDEICRKENIR